MGNKLTAIPGNWSPAPVALKFQWFRAGVPVPGARAASYPVTVSDLGKKITVQVTGLKTGYTPVSKTSAPTATVAAGTLTSTQAPKIAGTPKVGGVLTATPGTWSQSPVSIKYQWYRSGVAIPGATLSSYKLTAASLGKKLTVRVTGSKAGYTTLSKTSAPLTVTAGTLTTTPVPRISGTPKVGRVLTATPGVWSPSPVSLTYQWYRSGVAITGATAFQYKLNARDLAKKITVRVTGSKSGYTAVSKVSMPSRAVTG
ncbi:hypothetical protein HNO80_16590 [Arthrobacter sp. C9C5]|nr:hypothetical protein [Arthrobacter sp. C9C5]